MLEHYTNPLWQRIQYFAKTSLVNAILILGSERLHNDMVRRFGNNKGDAITLCRLDKSGGCVDRDNEFMKNTQELSIRDYFFGDLKRTLSPHTQQFTFDEVVIYQIRTANSALSSFLPAGEEEEKDTAVYEKVEPSPSMLHCIFAVMHAGVHDSQDAVRDASVMGFVYVRIAQEQIISIVSSQISSKLLILQ